MEDSVFRFNVKVYYEDTDAGGVVYHSNYLKYMERARSEYLVEKGCDIVLCEQQYGVIFLVKSLNIDYLLPAKLAETLSVETQILQLGKVGMSMNQSIYNAQQSLVCKASVKLASIAKTGEGKYVLKPMPKELRARLL